MADKLEWMNRHTVLLRSSVWKPVAERENYKIRADLKPMFDAHPDSLELLEEFGKKKLYREGCEFIARNLHRRAAVWWGYVCFLTLLEERREVKSGKKKNTQEQILPDMEKLLGFEIPGAKSMTDANGFPGPLPEINAEKLLGLPTPPQDNSAIQAASDAVKSGIDKLDAMLPSKVKELYSKNFSEIENIFSKNLGNSPRALFDKANELAKKSPLTYSVDLAKSPAIQNAIKLRDMIETMRQANIAQIKAAFPEKFPASADAARLLAAQKEKCKSDAVQAVYRWVIAPDEINSKSALDCGNASPGTPEGMLAYTAFWSFGDMMPAGKMIVPTPPELPGTGLNAALLMMALDPESHRKMQEKYELYFSLGMEVVFAKNLWPDAVKEELAPHQYLEQEKKHSGNGTAPDAPNGYKRWK